MSPKLHELLAALPARQLNLIVGGMLVIALLLAWTLGLRAPLAAYRQDKAALAALEAASANAPVAAPPAAPGAAITPAAAPVAPDPLALIAAVSHSASQSGVSVSSAAQGVARTVAGVRLITVDIAASGSYAAILDWLAAIEWQQPTVGINALTLEAPEDTDNRSATLQLVIYDTGTPPP
jgi:type II secretory pathway component PulM